MPSPLQWIFQLVDKVSAPAAAATKAVEAYDHAVKAAGASTDHHAKKMESAWKNFTHQVEHANEHTKNSLMKGLAEQFAIAEIAVKAVELLGEMAEKAAELGIEFAKDAIHAADFERSSRIAFTALLGSGEKAEEVMKGAKAFALEAGTPMKETMQAYKNLVMAKVAPTNIPIVLQAASDISNIRGEGASGMMAYAQAFADIQSRGQLAGRALMQFKGVLDMDVLAKKLGVATGGFAALQKRLEETPVSAGKGMRAILETLAEMQGGELGKVSKDVGLGWEGSMTKLATSWDIFMGKLEEGEGFKNILNIINRIAAAFDPTTESGKRMGRVFEELFHSVGEALKPLTKPGAMEDLVKSFISIAKSLGEITGGLVKMGLLTAAIPLQLKSDDAATRALGWKTAAGVYWGLLKAPLLPAKAMGKLVEGVIGTAQEDLEVHSPSRVMERLGMYTAEGFHQGLRRGGLADAVELNMPTGAGFRRSSAAAGGGGQQGGGVHVHQQFNINAGPGVDLEQLARRIAEISQGGLQSALEQMGLSMGTVGNA